MTEYDPPTGDRDPHRPSRVYAPDFLTELFRNPLDPGYADAAAKRRAGGASSGPTVRMISLVTLVVVGLLLAVAYRRTLADEPGRSKARAGLVAQITEREGENDRLAARADELRIEVARQRAAALGDTEAGRLRDLEAIAGLGQVRGDGVVVRLANAPAEKDAVTGAQGPNLGQVQDDDLQDVANALWASGAEAIAINGQRLTATSTIRTAGSAILVDFRPVASPYEVSAIGPDRMADQFSGSVAAATMRTVSAWHGMSFGVEDAEDLLLPAASQPRLRHAELPPEPTPSAGVGSSSTQSPTPTPSGGGR